MRSQISQRPNVVRFFAWAIATQFVTIGLLIGCNDITSDRAKKSTNQNLIGTWEFKNQDGAKTGTAIFEPKSDADGDVYILSNDLPSGKTAIAGKYKVNSSSNPQQLDLIFGDLTTQTIYEIGSDGQLKIANSVPDQARPTTLDRQPQLLNKVSESTTVANNVKILRSPDLISSSALIRQTEHKSYIRAIMRSQQQIFQQNGQFSNDVNQLMLGLPLNSDFYSYKITIWEDSRSGNLIQIVQNSAVPLKDGLKAYTGIVYAIANKDTNQKTTKSMMCESNLPTQVIPTKPKNQDEGYICPNAYTLIN